MIPVIIFHEDHSAFALWLIYPPWYYNAEVVGKLNTSKLSIKELGLEETSSSCVLRRSIINVNNSRINMWSSIRRRMLEMLSHMKTREEQSVLSSERLRWNHVHPVVGFTSCVFSQSAVRSEGRLPLLTHVCVIRLLWLITNKHSTDQSEYCVIWCLSANFHLHHTTADFSLSMCCTYTTTMVYNLICVKV